jgi:hypothetical protein
MIVKSNVMRSYTKYSGDFWNKIQKGEITECWPYLGRLDENGYGDIEINYVHTRAHRVAYSFYHEIEIPEGYFVCHGCDNPKCCNPFHLWLGTNLDNVRDCISKDRKPRLKGYENPMYGRIGVNCPSSKLNDEKVKEIRKRFASGEGTFSIGKHFGVSYQNVQSIVDRKTWKHVME